MVEMDRDLEVIRFMRAPQLSEPEMAEAIRRQAATYYERHQLGILAGILKSTGSLVGRYGLQYVEVEGVEELEVKYLTAAEHRRRGFASEALRGILLAAERERLSGVVALILSENMPSRRVAEGSDSSLRGRSPERVSKWPSIRCGWDEASSRQAFRAVIGHAAAAVPGGHYGTREGSPKWVLVFFSPRRVGGDSARSRERSAAYSRSRRRGPVGGGPRRQHLNVM